MAAAERHGHIVAPVNAASLQAVSAAACQLHDCLSLPAGPYRAGQGRVAAGGDAPGPRAWRPRLGRTASKRVRHAGRAQTGVAYDQRGVRAYAFKP